MAIKELELLLTANAGQAISEIEKLGATVDTKAASMGEKFASFGKAALIGTGIAVAAVAGFSVKMAEEFDKSDANLRNALKNQNQSWDGNQKAIQGAITQGAKYGNNAAVVEQQLSRGVTALGSVQKGTTALTLAQNVSAATHKDLAASMLLVIKGMEGNAGALKRAGIDLPIAAGGALKLQTAQTGLAKAEENLTTVEAKIADGRLKGPAAADALAKANDGVATAYGKVNDAGSAGAQITQALQDKFKGAADAASQTLGGQLKSATADIQNIGIKIGEFLIPILQTLVSGTMDVVNWFEKHQAVAIALAGAIGSLVAAAAGFYVYEKIASTVSKVVGAFNGIIGLVSRVVAFFAASAGGAAADAGAQEADAGATDANAAAHTGLGTAAAGSAAGLEAGGAAASGAAPEFAAAGAGIGAFGAGVTVAALALPAYMIAMSLTGKNSFDLGSKQDLARASTKQLSDAFTAQGAALIAGSSALSGAGQAIANHNAQVSMATTAHQDFQTVLATEPQYALKVMEAAQQAGIATNGWAKEAQAHIPLLEAMIQKNPALAATILPIIANLQQLGAQHPNPSMYVNDQATPTINAAHAALHALDGASARVTLSVDPSHMGVHGSGSYSYQGGGVVPGPPGMPTLATVHGSEVIVDPADPALGVAGLLQSGIFDKMSTGSAAPMIGASGGGGNNYNIAVSVGPASDPAMVGQQIVLAIEAHERRAGSSWRQRTTR